VNPAYVLCDPALLTAPIDSEPGARVEFWSRVIDWNRDSRLRLGPMTHEIVTGEFADRNWQTFEPPGCPVALARPARRAIFALLASVLVPVTQDVTTARAPSLHPQHDGGELVEEAIGLDAATLWHHGIVAIATDLENWSPPSASVSFDPEPPDALPLINTPNQKVESEADDEIKRALGGRRVTVVGGRQRAEVLTSVAQRFGLSWDRLRWIETDRKKSPRLNMLSGIRHESDIVVCVTGFMAHAHLESVEMLCSKDGVTLRCVEKRSEIMSVIEGLPHGPS
jgi:hypothetical protein